MGGGEGTGAGKCRGMCEAQGPGLVIHYITGGVCVVEGDKSGVRFYIST